MTHSLFKTGSYRVPAYLSPIDISGDDSEISGETELARLEGILNHIHYTKNLSDQRDKRQKKDKSTTIWNLFSEFLFFKYFGASKRPVIICEGGSDRIIYLRLAVCRTWRRDFHSKSMIRRMGTLIFC